MKPTQTTTRRLLSLPKAAEYLALSPRTLRWLKEAGRIPFIRLSPGRIAFDVADLNAYIEQQRR